jgi:hypothetical protein
MDERASDGTYNEIALTDLVDGKLPESFVSGKLNHADPTKRWYMSAPFDLVDPVREDPVMEDIGGIPMPVRQGNLMWTGTMVSSPAYLKALETHACGKNKVFFTVDAQGNLKGKQVLNDSGASVFRGRKIQNSTMYSVYNEGTKDEKQKIKLVFMVAETEKDAEFGFLSSASMSFNFHSLPQIFVTELAFEGDLTTTVFTFTASNYFGSFGEALPVTGLEAADFIFYNVTDDAVITMTSVEEDADTEGLYVGTASGAQTAGDTIRLTLDKDYHYAESITGVIPT